MRLYAFDPKTANLVIAQYVKKRLTAEIDAIKSVRQSADELVAAIMDVLTKTKPEELENFKAVLTAGAQQGYDDRNEQDLKEQLSQFIADLAPDIKAQL